MVYEKPSAWKNLPAQKVRGLPAWLVVWLRWLQGAAATALALVRSLAADESKRHQLILVSLAWSCVGLMLALLSPWLGMIPPWVKAPLDSLPLLVTIGLIALNLTAAIRLVGRTGRTLSALPLTVTQLILFTLLFFQIACHQGAEHYTWKELPNGWDWLAFSLVHAVRAADLWDIIEAYGLQLQTNRHVSNLTAVCLIVFHLLMDFFVISLLLEWIARARKALLADPRRVERMMKAAPWVVGSLVVVWLASALYFRPWRKVDLLLWPLDNLLRILDFMDALEIYRVRLHQVPRVFWEGTLTLICRLLFFLALAGALSWLGREISIRWLGGYGMRREDLEDIRLNHSDTQIRRKADQRLAALAALPSASPGVAPWTVPRRAVLTGTGLVAALALTIATCARWDGAAARLAAVAADPEHPKAHRALAALRQMGPYAETQVTRLNQSLPDLPRKRQFATLATLGYLGVEAIEPLSQHAVGADAELALRAVYALNQVGPQAAPGLVPALESPHEPVRKAAEYVLLAFGADAVQPLIDTLTPANTARHVTLLERLDPTYWYLRTASNPYAEKVLSSYPHVLALRSRIGGSDRHFKAVIALEKLGPAGSAAIPVLVERLAQKEQYDREWAAKALEQIDTNWRQSERARQAIPALVELLADKESMVRTAAAKTLGQFGPAASSAIPGLAMLLVDADIYVHKAASEALELIDWNWPRSEMARQTYPTLIPKLTEGLAGKHFYLQRTEAARALGRIGPDAVSAVPALVERLTDKGLEVQTATAAAEALGRIGPGAASAFPTLLDQLGTRDYNHTIAVRQALTQIDPVATVRALVSRLADENYRIRSNAEKYLYSIDRNWAQSEGARQAIPALMGRLNDKDPSVSSSARHWLDRIDKDWQHRPGK